MSLPGAYTAAETPNIYVMVSSWLQYITCYTPAAMLDGWHPEAILVA